MMKKSKNQSFEIKHNEAIKRWDEGVPLGNGLKGCLVYGDGEPLILSLDRGDLWDDREAPGIASEDFTYSKLIECVEKADNNLIRKIFDEPYNHATPTKIPAGHIELHFNDPVNVVSHLDYYEAKACITVKCKDGRSNVYIYMHATHCLGCIKIDDCSHLKKVDIIAPKFNNLEKADGQSRKCFGKYDLDQLSYQAAVYEGTNEHKWFIQPTNGGWEYGVLLFNQRNGDELTIYFDIASLSDNRNWVKEIAQRLESLSNIGWDQLLSEHQKWWADFWSKSCLQIPNESLEKMWVQANYFLGSASRKGAPPMPLQGVWVADDGKLPPWKGDYHNDLNTQISYSHYLKANHIDEGEAFIDMLVKLTPQAREFAKKFFDAPGLCLPGVMTIHGKPLGGWPMYSLNLTNQIWLCQIIERHGAYVDNPDFWKEVVFPYFSDTAECILRWFKKEDDGKRYLPLSSSPEIHEDKLEAFLKPNSNFDLALLRYLFRKLVWLSDKIGKDKAKWQQIFIELPELAVDDTCGLMISPNEKLTESHRHFSHAMAIYPLDLIRYNNSDKERKIIDDTINHLEILGTGLWVGFSFAWMAHLYSRQGNGEAAEYQLGTFYDHICSPNGFHLNGDFNKQGITNWHYRPFTLESNMFAADALQEMVLQDYEGIIRVFPAIPKKWAKQGVEFRNFRVRKGMTVSSAINDGQLQYIEIYSERYGKIAIQNRFNKQKLRVCDGGKEFEIECAEMKVFELHIEKNRRYKISQKFDGA